MTTPARGGGPSGVLTPRQWAERAGIPVALLQFADDRDRTPTVTGTVHRSEGGGCATPAWWPAGRERTCEPK